MRVYSYHLISHLLISPHGSLLISLCVSSYLRKGVSSYLLVSPRISSRECPHIPRISSYLLKGVSSYPRISLYLLYITSKMPFTPFFVSPPTHTSPSSSLTHSSRLPPLYPSGSAGACRRDSRPKRSCNERVSTTAPRPKLLTVPYMQAPLSVGSIPMGVSTTKL